MPNNPLIRYALDPTGINVDNLVQGEITTLSAAQVRAASPLYGPYFTESLVVTDNTTNRQLVRGTDYQCIDMLQEATLKFGKEISQLILIINPNVGGSIRMTYQVLGGLYQNDSRGLVNLYDTVALDGRPVDWSKVLNQPTAYNPAFHRHLLSSDVVGFQPLIVALERIRNAIILSDVPAFEAVLDWVKANAGSSVIFEPIVVAVNALETKTFNITTSNRANDTVLYWNIKHKGTADVHFVNVQGTMTLFQNRTSFSFSTSGVIPIGNKNFDIEIKTGSHTGPVVTVIEGIRYNGSNVPVIPPGSNPNDIVTLLTACCLYEPGIIINAESMFIIGDH